MPVGAFPQGEKMKRAIKLCVAFILVSMLFAVLASAESYTVDYYNIKGDSKKATETTDENGAITLKSSGYDTTAEKEFYGWFTEDGTFYKAGETVTLSANTKLFEACAYLVANENDFNSTYDKCGHLVKLTADLTFTSRVDLAEQGIHYIDLNGHTITFAPTTNSDAIWIKRGGAKFYNSSETPANLIATTLNNSKRGFFTGERHGYGDSKNIGLTIGKNVNVKTNGALFRMVNGFFDYVKWDANGLYCPWINIYGSVEADTILRSSNENGTNSLATYQAPITIGDGAYVKLTGTTWWVNPNWTVSNEIIGYLNIGDATIITNDGFEWETNYIYVKHNVTGGSYSHKIPDAFIQENYACVYNSETKFYDVKPVSCTLEGSNGVHNYNRAEVYGDYASTCTEDGLAYFRCGCGSFYVDDLDALGHDYSIVEIIKVATSSSAGEKKYTCVTCSDSYVQDYVIDASDLFVTAVVKGADGVNKTISVLYKDVFLTTANADGSVTLNGIADTITVSENEVYTKSDIVKLEIFGVTTIATGAIKDMESLVEIVIADGSNITFETASFDNCASLETLVLGSGTNATFKQFTVKSSAKDTNDSPKTTVTVPTCPNFATINARGANVTLENFAFRFNGAIKHFLMSEGNTYKFGRFAFHRSSLEEVVLPDNSNVTLAIKAFAETKTIKYVYIGANCITAKTSDGKIALGDDSSNTSIFGGNEVLEKVVMMDIQYIGKWTFSVKTTGDYVAKNDIYIYSHADSLTFNASECSINDRTKFNVFIYANSTTNTPKNCHYVIYKGIPHKYTAEDSDPTCVLPGSKGYSTDCPCGAVTNGEYSVIAYSSYSGDKTGGTITVGEITPALGHEFNPEKGATLVSQTEAKCGEKAKATYKCARCDETTTVEVGETKQHTVGQTTRVEPSCTTDGALQVTCADCKQIMSAEVIPATGHTANGKWEIIEEGTCTVGETRGQYCANDGCSYVALSETDAPSGHTPSNNWTVVVEQTCLEGGMKYQRCATCNTICEEVVTDALGHEFDIADGAIVSKIKYENGFDKNGTVYVKCLRCDETSDSECAPIFSAKGYSVNESGTALNGGYTVDLSLLKAYMEVNGEVEFGVIIANANTFNGSFFEKNAVNNSKALQVVIDAEYSNFDCSISFGTTSNNTLELVICAYVIDENGNATFIQAQNDYALEATIGEQTFTKVTLDLVKANVPQAPVAILPSTNDEE